jgi:hypothetical protein
MSSRDLADVMKEVHDTRLAASDNEPLQGQVEDLDEKFRLFMEETNRNVVTLQYQFQAIEAWAGMYQSWSETTHANVQRMLTQVNEEQPGEDGRPEQSNHS